MGINRYLALFGVIWRYIGAGKLTTATRKRAQYRAQTSG